jgi:uracil-DNA glycosylase
VKVIVALGQIAFTQTLRSLRLKGLEIPAWVFGHDRIYPLPSGQTLISTYHPSQQNTQTGKLTHRMFDQIFKEVRKNL